MRRAKCGAQKRLQLMCNGIQRVLRLRHGQRLVAAVRAIARDGRVVRGHVAMLRTPHGSAQCLHLRWANDLNTRDGMSTGGTLSKRE